MPPKLNRRYDSRRYDSQRLNIRDLEIMSSLEIDKNSVKETAEKVHVSPKTVTRTTKKQAYRDCLLASLVEKSVTVETVAQSLKDLMEANKNINVKDEGLQEVSDNIVRFNATAKICDIMGVDAPKEFDLKHSMAAMSDEELEAAVKASAKELHGNVQHSITGTSNAKSVIANTIADGKPELVEQPREQAVRPADSGAVEGTVL